MKVGRLVMSVCQTNCYFIYHDTDEAEKEVVFIDPGDKGKQINDALKQKGFRVGAILLTHGHFDHIMGIDQFETEYGKLPVYVHEGDKETMVDPVLNQSSVYTNGYTYANAELIHEGQVLSIAGFDFKVIHTPGHTPGGACYYLEDEKVLFSGDTLFQRSVGRTDFVNSSTSDLLRGIKEKLFVLPDDVLVYPGHMGETKIGYEKEHNMYV